MWKGLHYGKMALYNSYNKKTNHNIILVVPWFFKPTCTGKRQAGTAPSPMLFNPNTAVTLTHNFAGLPLDKETRF
jgi:hypothetical protein